MKLMKYVLMLVLLLNTFSVFSQTKQTVVPSSVNGAEHPALIPDSVVYRMVFLAASVPPNATVAEVNHQNVLLKMLGISSQGQEAIRPILNSFRATMVYHNSNVKLSHLPNNKQFKDNLVMQTRSKINAVLSDQDQRTLEAFVNSQRKYIVTNEVE